MALDRNSPIPAIPSHRPSVPSALRLCLCATLPSQGMLDGGWWPRSRNPTVEVPKLIGGLNTHCGQLGTVTRVALNLTAWDPTPSRLAIGDRIVPVTWSRTLNMWMAALTTTRHDRVTLLVVPPEATADSAAIALAMAAMEDNSAEPLAILALSGITASDPLAASLARHPSRSSVRSPAKPAGRRPVHPVP